MSEQSEINTSGLPGEGDCLFECGNFSIDHAGVHSSEIHRFHAMKVGYKLAGDVLVQYWLASTRGVHNDRLIFPILFCYRHFLELSMKWLLWHREEYRSICIFKTHDLKNLWQILRLVLQDVRLDSEPQVEAAQGLIFELNEKDKGSFNFRYSHDKRGEAIDLDFQEVDLIRIRECIQKLDNFFGIVDTVVQVELESRADFS